MLGFCALVVSAEAARAEVIDQANNQFYPTASFSILTGYGEGQSFRPSLDGIDFVRLRLYRMSDYMPAPVDMVLDLHHESRDTPAIATTPAITLDGPGEHLVTFEFSSTVALVPGNTYLFIVRYVGWLHNWGIGCGLNWYADGQLIAMWGNPELYDAWFEEGITGNTPIEPDSWGRTKALYR
jgi:hypothetical protein